MVPVRKKSEPVISQHRWPHTTIVFREAFVTAASAIVRAGPFFKKVKIPAAGVK